jgi:hypothetical protein
LGFEIPDHGDCEFCRDHGKRKDLESAAQRIRNCEINPETWSPAPPLLPVLNNSAGGACGGCGGPG